MSRAFGLAMTAAVAGYGLLLNGYLAAHTACLDCHPLLAQANHLAHFITLSGVIVLVVAIILRVPRGVLMWMMPSVMAFGLWYGPNFLPRPEPNVAGDALTVATFNALDDITLPERANPEDTLAVIAGLDADIIAVQELGPLLRYRLEDDLHAAYPYQVHKVLFGYEGLGLLSRYPIVESEMHILVLEDEDYDAAPRYIRAVIDLNGRQVAVYNFHPTRPAFHPGRNYDDVFHEMNVRAMLDLLAHEDLPILMLCDCNVTPRSRPFQWLDEAFGNAFDARGWGFGMTFPANGQRAPFPIMRIDHIWFSDDFTALAAEVRHESGGSDHLPLWGRLVLRSP